MLGIFFLKTFIVSCDFQTPQLVSNSFSWNTLCFLHQCRHGCLYRCEFLL